MTILITRGDRLLPDTDNEAIAENVHALLELPCAKTRKVRFSNHSVTFLFSH